MKRLIILALLVLSSANALAHDSASFPNGDYCTVGGNHHQKIRCTNKNASKWNTAYIQKTSGGLPGDYALGQLSPSPNGKYLYFEGPGGATMGSVYRLNMNTDKVTNFMGGDLDCVVLGGPYKGDLIIRSQSFYLGGGSYFPINLFTPAGKNEGRLLKPTHCTTFGEYN